MEDPGVDVASPAVASVVVAADSRECPAVEVVAVSCLLEVDLCPTCPWVVEDHHESHVEVGSCLEDEILVGTEVVVACLVEVACLAASWVVVDWPMEEVDLDCLSSVEMEDPLAAWEEDPHSLELVAGAELASCGLVAVGGEA